MTRKTEAEMALILERQAQVVEMRKRGKTFRQIGTELNISHVTAVRDMQAALRGLRAERSKRTELLVTLEAERLDMLFAALVDKALEGDPQVAAVALKIRESYRKLLGLDAPSKVAPTDPTGEKPASMPVVFLPAVIDADDDDST